MIWANVRDRLARGLGLKATPVDIVDDDRLWAEIRDYATAYMLPVFEAIYLGGVEIGLRMVEIARRRQRKEWSVKQDETLPDRIRRRAADEALRQTGAWFDQLAPGMRHQVFSAMTQAVDAGLSTGEAVGMLEPLFGKVRAERIAVTETNRIVGLAAQHVYAELGIGLWDWRTAADSKVDEVCKARAAAGPYSMAERFSPAHVRCRCWPVPHITDEDEVLDDLPPDAPPADQRSIQDQLLRREDPPEFKTPGAAEKWLTERHPSVTWDMKKVAAGFLAPTARVMDRMLVNFPGIADRLKYVGSYGTLKASVVNRTRFKWKPRTVAHAAVNGDYLAVNHRYFRTPERLASADALSYRTGWHRPMLPGYHLVDQTLTHEVGHLVDSWLRSHPDIGDAYRAFRAQHIDRPHRTAGAFSGYAKDTDFEHFAEMFATYQIGDRNAARAAWPTFARFERMMDAIDPINARTIDEMNAILRALTDEPWG